MCFFVAWAFCASLWHIVTLVSDDKELVFRPLHQSPIISVHDYCCHIARSGPGAEEESPANNIVLMRHGAFSRHFGRRTVTADVNQAVFFSRDSTYRVSHPADCRDRGTIFNIAPRVLNDIVRELDPSVDDHPEQPFLFVTGPCDDRVFWRHRELVQRLESAESNPLDPLQTRSAGSLESLHQKSATDLEVANRRLLLLCLSSVQFIFRGRQTHEHEQMSGL